MRKAALYIAIIVGSLLAAEIIARMVLWQPAPEADVGRIRYGYSPDTAGELYPGQDGVYITHKITRFHPFYVATNAEGFRNRRDVDPKAARILALGDSTTFGLNANSQDIWTDWLEHRLQRQGVDAQVLNAAMPGSTITDQLEYYRDKGRFLGAGLVILCPHDNDIDELLRPVSMRQGGLETARATSMADMRWFLGHNSALYSAARAVKERVQNSGIKEENHEVFAVAGTHGDTREAGYTPSGSGVRSDPEVLARYEGLFGEIAGEVAASGARLMVAYLPSHQNGPSPLTLFFKDLAERHGASFVDLGQATNSLPFEEIWLVRSQDPTYPSDGHLSRVGNMRVAQVLADALAGAKLLPSAPPPVR